MTADRIRTVAVVGSGIMGAGIAQSFAEAGRRVLLVDVLDDKLEQAMQAIRAGLAGFAQAGLLAEPADTIAARVLKFCTEDLRTLGNDVDFVVESTPELLDVKRAVFAELDTLPADTILASNTSSFTISRIAELMRTPERVVGTHYFNPAAIIPAVEVHCGEYTADSAVDTTLALLKACRKQAIVVRRELPGFVINRLTGAIEREIDYLLDTGVVSPEALDLAVRASFGFRLACLGPMEAEDLIGLDTAARVSANLYPELSNATAPSPELLAKVERGELGVKSGKGWYEYPDDARERLAAERSRHLLEQLRLFRLREQGR